MILLAFTKVDLQNAPKRYTMFVFFLGLYLQKNIENPL